MNSLRRGLRSGEIVVIAAYMFESPHPFMADRAFIAVGGAGMSAAQDGAILAGFWWSDAPDERGEMQVVIATAIDSKDTAQFNAALKSQDIAELGFVEVLVDGECYCARERDVKGASETASGCLRAVPLFDCDGRFRFRVKRDRVGMWSPPPDFQDEAAYWRWIDRQPRNGEIILPCKPRQLKKAESIIIEGKAHHG